MGLFDIFKRKKQPKASTRPYHVYEKTSSEEPDNSLAGMLFERQEPDDDNYGLKVWNPILVSGEGNALNYLKCLRTLDDKPVTWKPHGYLQVKEVHGVFAQKGSINVIKYDLFLEDEHYESIYICTDSYNTPYTPKGMKLCD